MADEPWFAVIESATGRALSFGTRVAEALPSGCATIVIDHAPNFRTELWDEATRTLVARPAALDVMAGDKIVDILGDATLPARLRPGGADRSALQTVLERHLGDVRKY